METFPVLLRIIIVELALWMGFSKHFPYASCIILLLPTLKTGKLINFNGVTPGL